MRRGHPGVRRLAAAVAAGDLGLPWSVQAEQVIRGGDSATLLELFAESFDAVQSVLGLEARSVIARASGDPDGDDGVLSATMIFDHEVGASITVSRIAAPGLDEARIRVMGNEGVVLVDLGRPGLLIDGGADVRTYGPTVLDDPPTEAVAGVLSAVRRSLVENAVIGVEGS